MKIFKKILLLTDIPPCSNLTAGIFLSQLCSFLPKGSLACFTVLTKGLEPKIIDALKWIPIEYCEKPPGNYAIFPSNFGFRKAISLLNELYIANIEEKRIVNKIIKFAKKNKTNVIWAVLQGQTMIRLALPVAKKLKLPLYSNVWDPPFWWLRHNCVDKISRGYILKQFDRTISSSVSCGTASWAMAEKYHKIYGTKTVPFIPSLGEDLLLKPASSLNNSKEFIIGLAGQIYAKDCWDGLMNSLNSVNWKINGKDVVIHLLGGYTNFIVTGRMNIVFLGWRSQKESIKIMSKCDALYLPYWFDKNFEEEARLSFPSKYTTYIASGRPVFFHGPKYASPGRFIEKNKAGICCYSNESRIIIATLKKLITNKKLYSDITKNGSEAFKKYFTLADLKKSFAEFLNIDEKELL